MGAVCRSTPQVERADATNGIQGRLDFGGSVAGGPVEDYPAIADLGRAFATHLHACPRFWNCPLNDEVRIRDLSFSMAGICVALGIASDF